MNIQGLEQRTKKSTKRPFLGDVLYLKDQLFVALTETWLREQKEAELDISGYKIFRQDRNRPRRNRRSRDSGGVAFYIRDDLVSSAETVLEFSSGVVEILGVYLKEANILAIVIYRQPDDIRGGNRSTSIQFHRAISAIRRTLSELETPTPEIMLSGDLNLPHVVWPEGIMGPGGTADERIMLNELRNLADDFFLQQHITKPTHRAGNTLDLVFTNNENALHSYTSTPTKLSDHYVVECATLYNTKPVEPKEAVEIPEGMASLNFQNENIDWDKMRQDTAAIDWDDELKTLHPQQMLDKLVDKCNSVATLHVPLRRKYTATSNSSRIPSERKNLMRKRTRKTSQLHGTNSAVKKQKITDELISIEKALIYSYQKSREDEEKKAVEAITRNPKYFFSYAKKYSNTRTTVGPLLDDTGELVNDSAKMADMLAQQYSSVFSTPLRPIPHEPPDEKPTEESSAIPKVYNIPFTEDDLKEAIDDLNATSAAGPDGFPAIFLKECREELARPLYLIWRESLDRGIVPDSTKRANIVPVHKGGSRGIPKQYRPVALTSHIIKIFEKVLRKYLVSFIDENHLFNQEQHGFRSGRSCLSQLLSHYDRILEALEAGSNVDVIYLDFSKAFDKVDFAVTIEKLMRLGIRGKIVTWIRSFLTDRYQSVIVNGKFSHPCEVRSGVPQGSVLGPLLFLILIGDIDQNVASSFVSSFADDTRIGKPINSAEDAKLLQKDLESIYAWAKQNNMQFNTEKFECIKYGKKEDLKESCQYKTQDDQIIAEKDVVRDLGIVMSNKGSFKAHIDKISATAKSVSSWILRTFKTREKGPMLTLWKTLVLPHLDYCCQLWTTNKVGDIQALEQIQKSFIQKIAGYGHLDYWQKLAEFRLYSLQRRRERYSIIYTWRMIEKQVPSTGIEAGTTSRGRRCIVPPINAAADKWAQKLREDSFNVRGPTLFNCTPNSVRNLTECKTNVFKSALDKWLGRIPDEPQVPGYTAMRRAETNSVRHMTSYVMQDSSPTVPWPPGLPLSYQEAAPSGDLGGL